MFHRPQRFAAFALLPALLVVASAARGDVWTGIGSDWFSSTSWELANNGPPGSTENAFFQDNYFGIPLAVTNVQLSASTTIQALIVDSPVTKQYTFTGANGAVLTATSQMDFKNSDGQALNVHTIQSLGLNTPDVDVIDNAILSLNNSTVTTNFIGVVDDGRIDVNNGSSVQTLGYGFDQAAGELRVNSGGELRIVGDTTLLRGTTTINSGGQLNALSGVDLQYKGTALLQIIGAHTVDDGVTLRATDGGDITAGEYIDIGNGGVGSLTVSGAGSTLTAQSSISDWGAGSSGNATVTIASSGVATVSQLRAGTGGAVFQGNVTSGATLRSTSTFRMGGGATVRTVSLTVDGGTLQTDGLATFDNRADLNLISGTVAFNGGATFNSGSRIDWSGGNLNLANNTTLLVDGGVVNRTSSAGFSLAGNTTTRIRNNGVFTTPSFFDLGAATLDMNNGFLTVGVTGGTVSDWGRNSGLTTSATLANSAVATYNSGLRMSQLGGTTSATISSAARLITNGSLDSGGDPNSSVTLNVTGGRIESDGSINLLRGTTTTVSSAGAIEGQNVVLGSSLGNTSTTVTGINSLLKARGTLTAGRAGTSTLTISAGGEAESLGSTIIGELAGANATVTVAGAGSRLDVGSSLTIGAGGTGRLNIDAGGYVPVTGRVTVGGSGTLSLNGGGSSIETTPGQSLVNSGVVEAIFGSQIRADVTSAGSINLFDSSITRSVTLQANSVMNVDNATVGSLTQQAGADIHFGLLSASDFGTLAANGPANLAGDFVITLGSGFTPTLGMTFPIFTAGSITGSPSNFDLSAAQLPSGLGWGVSFGPTSLGLTVIPVAVLHGDYNDNDVVDAADYSLYRDNVGTNTVLPNDPTGGTIGVAQYNTWRNNFGQSGNLNALAATASVPEPNAVVFALALGAALKSMGVNAKRRPATHVKRKCSEQLLSATA